MSEPFNYPFLLQNGQLADAEQVMANFDAIQAYLSALGSSLLSIRVISSGSTIAVLTTDQVLLVRKSTGSQTVFQLPAQNAFPLCQSSGLCPQFMFKDGKGDAAANPITLTSLDGATFDGQQTFVMNQSYGEITAYSDGTNWNIK